MTGNTQLPVGASLVVRLPNPAPALFDGEITAVEYVYQSDQTCLTRLRAYDRLHRLRKQQPVRVHVDQSLDELARECVKQLGIDVRSDTSGPIWPRIVQHCQSDFELLAQRAADCGLFFYLHDRVLNIFSLAGGGGPPVALAWGQNLFEVRLEINAATSTAAVEAAGWNPWRVEQHHGRAGTPRSGHDIAARVDAARVGADTQRLMVDQLVQHDRLAESLAQGELDRQVARTVVLTGVADGDPRLQPGLPIEVTGVPSPLAGRHVLSAVSHRLDADHGYISQISTIPPPPPRRKRGMVASMGRVTQIDDPEAMGRVKVCLPTYGNLESDWLAVLTMGAGAGKGLVIQPDLDDQVLVLLERNDPAQGVILGGLYGSSSRPADSDWGVAQDAVKRFTFHTPGGQRIQLDDANQRLVLEIGDGSFLELTPKRVLLHAETELVMEAPGQQVRIKGRNIDFEQI
jgi:phage baseplate assembly protein gpV/phage protein D